MSLTHIFAILCLLGCAFSIHPILGLLALVFSFVVCYISWRAEERRLDGAVQAYANMAAKERRDAKLPLF
jgi:protein-S-isoprenylcysteine O-methyltransferase Ste14